MSPDLLERNWSIFVKYMKLFTSQTLCQLYFLFWQNQRFRSPKQFPLKANGIYFWSPIIQLVLIAICIPRSYLLGPLANFSPLKYIRYERHHRGWNLAPCVLVSFAASENLPSSGRVRINFRSRFFRSRWSSIWVHYVPRFLLLLRWLWAMVFVLFFSSPLPWVWFCPHRITFSSVILLKSFKNAYPRHFFGWSALFCRLLTCSRIPRQTLFMLCLYFWRKCIFL